MGSLAEVIAQLGLQGGLIVFFVWVSWKREQGLTDRVTDCENALREMEETHKMELISLIKDSTTVMKENHRVIVDLSNHIRAMCDSSAKVLQSLPCKYVDRG